VDYDKLLELGESALTKSLLRHVNRALAVVAYPAVLMLLPCVHMSSMRLAGIHVLRRSLSSISVTPDKECAGTHRECSHTWHMLLLLCFAVACIDAPSITLPLAPAGPSAAQLHSSNRAGNASGSSAWPVEQGAAAQDMASVLLGNAGKVMLLYPQHGRVLC
jgi:hypothetical protein